jgi:hypothetical protein
MRAPAALLALALIAGAAAYFVLRRPGTADAELARAAGAAPAIPAQDASLNSGSLAADDSAPVADATPANRSAITGESAAVDASAPTEELWIVDAATRAPIADATVHFADVPPDEVRSTWFDFIDGLGPGCRRVEQEGRALRSDAAGIVRLPKPNGTGVAVARKGDLFGLWWREENAPRPWTLALERDGAWIVHARDVAGRPIPGLPITLSARQPAPRTPYPLASVATDANGEARFEHAAWLLARRDEDAFSIAATALLLEPRRLEFEGRRVPAQPTELVLAELGLVHVRLLDPDGAELSPADPKSSQQNVWLRSVDAPRELKSDPGVARATGPQRAFEEVEIAIQPGLRFPLVRMRVLDEHGPCVERQLLVSRRTTTGSGGSSDGTSPRTDAHGVVVLPLEELAAGTLTVLTVADAENEALQALVRLEQPVAGGWVDVGDVRLAEAPILVAGSVTDDAGAPIAGARVAVQGAVSEQNTPAQDPTLQLTAQQLEHRRKVRFMLGPHWSTTSDASGRFEVRAIPNCAELELSAQLGDRPRSDAVECAVGARDVRLVIARSGTLAGRLILSPELPARDVRLTIEPTQEREITDSRDSAYATIADDGAWHASGVRAGRWKIRVQDGRVFAWEPLVPIVEVDVVAGRTRVVTAYAGKQRMLLSVRRRADVGTPRFEWVRSEAAPLEIPAHGLAAGEALELDVDPALVRAGVERLRAQ